MKTTDTLSTPVDWYLWMQATKYVVWGILAATLNDLCGVMHGIRYLLFA